MFSFRKRIRETNICCKNQFWVDSNRLLYRWSIQKRQYNSAVGYFLALERQTGLLYNLRIITSYRDAFRRNAPIKASQNDNQNHYLWLLYLYSEVLFFQATSVLYLDIWNLKEIVNLYWMEKKNLFEWTNERINFGCFFRYSNCMMQCIKTL